MFQNLEKKTRLKCWCSDIMPTKLQIKWELPPDLANVAASILYRAEDPGQNKTCQDVVNTGSLVVAILSLHFKTII